MRAASAVAVAALVWAAAATASPPRPVELELVSLTVRVSAAAGARYEIDRLYDGPSFAKGRPTVVGSDRTVVRGRWVRVDAGVPGGTITASGLLAVRGGIGHVPVVSGTGRYRGARGELLIWNVPSSGGYAENVYRLR